jgi:hypothetical protein
MNSLRTFFADMLPILPLAGLYSFIVFVAMLMAFSRGVATGLQEATRDPMIHHPVYGSYPAKVPYQPGMDVMPGQTVTVEIPLGGSTENPGNDPRNRN